MSQSASSVKVKVNPPIQFEGGEIASIRGPIDEVLAYIMGEKVNPANMVAFGQNGHMFEQYASVEAHAIYIIEGKKPIDVASIKTSLIKSHMLRQFDYAHLIAGLSGNVQIGVFGDKFQANMFGQYVLTALYRTFFKPTNVLKHMTGTEETNSLLLIGDEGKRVVAAQVTEQHDTYRILANPVIGVTEQRHAVIGNTFLSVGYNTKEIYGVNAENILEYLTGKTDEIQYQTAVFDFGVEDIAPVGGTKNTVILTVADKSLRLIPTIVAYKNGEFRLIASLQESVRIEDLGHEVVSPIVRVMQSGRIVLANQKLDVHFDRLQNFGKVFETMITRATRGQLTANAAY